MQSIILLRFFFKVVVTWMHHCFLCKGKLVKCVQFLLVIGKKYIPLVLSTFACVNSKIRRNQTCKILDRVNGFHHNFPCSPSHLFIYSFSVPTVPLLSTPDPSLVTIYMPSDLGGLSRVRKVGTRATLIFITIIFFGSGNSLIKEKRYCMQEMYIVWHAQNSNTLTGSLGKRNVLPMFSPSLFPSHLAYSFYLMVTKEEKGGIWAGKYLKKE